MARDRRRSPFKALAQKDRSKARDKAMAVARRNQALNGLENARRALPGQIQDSQKRGKTQAEVNRVMQQSKGTRRGQDIQAAGIREQGQAIRRGADLSAKKVGQPGQGWKINQNKNSPRFGKRYKESGEGGSVHTYAPLSFSESHKFVVPPNRAKKTGGKYGSAASAVAGKMAQAKQRAKKSTPRAGLPMNPRRQGWGQGRADMVMRRFPMPRSNVPKPGDLGGTARLSSASVPGGGGNYPMGDKRRHYKYRGKGRQGRAILPNQQKRYT